MKLGDLVLIIDDDMAIAEAVGDMLRTGGYSVAIAHNGFRGLRLVREMKPSAVVCDMAMPDLTGADVLQILASDPGTTQIPRVMMTGHVDADRSNADAFLLKPFQPNDLLNLLQRLEPKSNPKQDASVDREIFARERVRKPTPSHN